MTITSNGNLTNIHVHNQLYRLVCRYLMLTFPYGIIKPPYVGSQVRVGSQGSLDLINVEKIKIHMYMQVMNQLIHKHNCK